MTDSVERALLQTGVPTLHTRCEAWECDYNGHWNTRYYCRSFEAAGRVAAALADNDGQGGTRAPRHLRFHRELKSGDPVTICSFAILDAPEAPLTAHYMFRYDMVVATALDYGLPWNERLPALPAAEAMQALPRGLTGSRAEASEPDPPRDFVYELGPVRADELYADGAMQFWHAVVRMSPAAHHHDLGIGFTLELIQDRGIGRMLAEIRYTWLGPCTEHDFLRAASRLTSAKGKAFTAAHYLYTREGAPIAMFEVCTLAVDMNTRRAIQLPDFMAARLS